jgi:hypothetical protein
MLIYRQPVVTLPFSDSFNEPERQGTDGHPLWTTVSGNWVISNHEYTSTSGFDALVIAGSSNWTNYTLEVTVKPINYGEFFYHSPRIVFYYKDSNNYYELALNKGDTKNIVLRKVVNGTSILLTINSSNVSEGKSYKVKVILDNLHISIYVDNILKIDFIDSNGTASGKIGLRSGGNGKHHFDNVSVS